MSRKANTPITIPTGVKIDLSSSDIVVEGSKGTLKIVKHPLVGIEHTDDTIKSFAQQESVKLSRALAGTYRMLVANAVHGVSHGFEKKTSINWSRL